MTWNRLCGYFLPKLVLKWSLGMTIITSKKGHSLKVNSFLSKVFDFLLAIRKLKHWQVRSKICHSNSCFFPKTVWLLSFHLRYQKLVTFCFKNKGPFKYYVIKILTLLDPTHPVCNQSLLIKQTNLCYCVIISPTPPTHSSWLRNIWMVPKITFHFTLL